MGGDPSAVELPNLNLADAYDAIAATIPDADAVLKGSERRTWSRYEANASAVAAALTSRGHGRGTKVAFFLRNHIEYLEAQYACFKLGAVPCNVNFRYTADELRFLLHNADAEVVLFDADLVERVAAVRADLGGSCTFVCVGDELSDGPSWVVPYEALIDEDNPRASAYGRSGDDLWFLYTGGTTGVPKAVMWQHAALVAITAVYFRGLRLDVPTTADHAARNVAEIHERAKVIRLGIPAPLIHGTANFAAQAVHLQGGCVVMNESASFSAAEQLGAVESERLTNLVIVGDAFGRPIVDELERATAVGKDYDISTLRVVQSSGVMWSAPLKERLRAFQPSMVQVDSLGSSEGVDLAAAVSRAGGDSTTARFTLSDRAAVFTEDGRRVEPGSGERGLLAAGGVLPLGYYKDPEKTATTYHTIEGRRWAIPGDWATVESDGTIVLLGRGSVCINTGGEKVFPEEVEEALKLHADVLDCTVVGVDDPRWGQRVVAVLQLGSDVTDEGLHQHAHETLAGFKAPKQYVRVDRFRRHANGKPDYVWAKRVAAEVDSAPS